MTDKSRRSSFTDAETLALRKARVKLEQLFSGKRNAAKAGWEQVVKEIGLEGQVTALQASKKWDNLKTKYKELKNPPTGTGMDSGEATAATWPWFDAMHEALGERPSIQPPTLVASCLASNPGLPAAEASPCTNATSGGEVPSGYDDSSCEEEEDSMPSTSSQPPSKRPRRGTSVLSFLKKQAEKEQARDAALYEQNEQFLNLFRELVKKNKQSKQSCCVDFKM